LKALITRKGTVTPISLGVVSLFTATLFFLKVAEISPPYQADKVLDGVITLEDRDKHATMPEKAIQAPEITLRPQRTVEKLANHVG
jgi:hypothetical protein